MIVQLVIIGGAFLLTRGAARLGIPAILPGRRLDGGPVSVDPCAHGELTFINSAGVPTPCRLIGPQPVERPPVFNCIMAPCPGDRGYPGDLPTGQSDDPAAPWFLT